MKARGQAGFTLLEILVAATILAVTFTAIFRLYGGTLRSLENSEKYARATVLAERKMNEALMAAPFPPASEQGAFQDIPDFSFRTAIGEYGGPIGRADKSIMRDQPTAVTYRVAVTVEWPEQNTRRLLGLETLKTVVEGPR